MQLTLISFQSYGFWGFFVCFRHKLELNKADCAPAKKSILDKIESFSL